VRLKGSLKDGNLLVQ